MNKILRFFFFFITNILLTPIQILLWATHTTIWYRGGSAVGDHVIMTGALGHITRKYNYRTILLTSFPDIFKNNPNIKKIINLNKLPRIIAQTLFFFFTYNRHKHMVYFMVQPKDGLGYGDYMRKSKSREHLREVHMRHTQFYKQIKGQKICNEMYLDKDEQAQAAKKFDNLPKKFGLIHSHIKASYAPIKDWGVENMQAVVDQKQLPWIQIGTPDQVELKNVHTKYLNISLRELAYLLSKASVVVCAEGLYTHMSSVYQTPCITVFSGLTWPDLSSYPNVTPITHKMPCAPCWALGKPCPKFDEAKCIKSVTPLQVTRLVTKTLASKK